MNKCYHIWTTLHVIADLEVEADSFEEAVELAKYGLDFNDNTFGVCPVGQVGIEENTGEISVLDLTWADYLDGNAWENALGEEV